MARRFQCSLMTGKNSVAALLLVMAAIGHDLGPHSRAQIAKQNSDGSNLNDDGIVLLQTRAGVVKRHSHPDALAEADANESVLLLLMHGGEDCWDPCGQKGGYCDWCGSGNMCCRQGFDENPNECANITSYRPMVKSHQCVASQATYALDAKHMCGACGEENDLHVGIGGRNFDAATQGSAMEICGAICDGHEECGGFSHSASLEKCFYRRVTSCQRAENADRDCYTKAGTRQNQLMTANYIRDAGRKCGACGDSNNLMLGVDNKPFDNATKEDVVKVCGAKCNGNKECGGFNFIESLGQCQYRKATSCQASQDADSDCFTKVLASQVGDSTKHQLAAQAHNLQAKLRQLEATLENKENDTLRLQTALAAQSNGATDAHDLLPFGNATGEPASLDDAAQSQILTEEEVTARSDVATNGNSSADAGDLLPFGNASGVRATLDVGAESQMLTEEKVAAESDGAFHGNSSAEARDLLPFGNATGEHAPLDVGSPSQRLTEEEVTAQSDGAFHGNSSTDASGLLPFGNATGEHAPLDQATLAEKQLEVTKQGEAGDNATLQNISGASVALDEAGYKSVVALWNATEMEVLIRRVASEIGCSIVDDGGLKGFVPFYSMENAQTLEGLKAELQSISTGNHSAGDTPWIVPSGRSKENEGLGNVSVSGAAPGQESMMEQDSGVHYHSGDLLTETSDAAASLWRIPKIWWPGDLIKHITASAQIPSSVGAVATLDEVGYAEVITQGNNTDLAFFTRRLIDNLGCNVTDEGGLEGFVPFYGKDTGQNYTSLRAELVSVSQLPGAWLAPHQETLLEEASTRAQVLTAIQHLAARVPAALQHGDKAEHE